MIILFPMMMNYQENEVVDAPAGRLYDMHGKETTPTVVDHHK